MKIRKGFVSNSSSSSFIIGIDDLSEEQICALKAHCSSPVGAYKDEWSILISEYKVTGFTDMRNNSPNEHEGDISDWMKKNDFPMSKITWEND